MTTMAIPAPRDILTEPSDDTLANLCPLAGHSLARKCADSASRLDGPERRVFIEKMDFQAIFPDQALRTDSCKMSLSIHNDGSWSYAIDTELTVEGRDTLFLRQDRNALRRREEAHANPRAAIPARRKAA
ncbi:MAG: hypothetical protein CMN72_03785 [Sphingomonas sp.]|nr:hypothetical protein [Sphingomonas sp.]